MRICFSKTGPLRYIGHLDFLKVFQQTIRRAGLPMAYSQGFNPHMQLSFALPLPLGMVSTRDYADLTLESELPGDEIVVRLNACAPTGLCVNSAWEYSGPGAAALVMVADYLFCGLPLEMLENQHDIEEKILYPVLSQDSIVIPKKTKSGIKDTDIRPDIFSLSVASGITSANTEMIQDSQDTNILMRLAAGSGRFLSPLIVAKLLTGQDADISAIIRHDLYRQDKEKGLISLNEAPIH